LNTKVEISKRLVLINSSSAVLTHVLKVCVLLWLYQHLLQRISADEYALIPVVTAIMLFPPLLARVLTGGLGRYITEAYAKGDDRRAVQIVSTMFPVLAAAGVLILAGGLTLAWYVDRVLTIVPERIWDARIMTGLLMFEVALGFPAAAFSVGFHVRQKFVLANMIQLGSELVRIAVLFVLLFAVSTRALWVIVASVSGGLTGVGVKLAGSRILLPGLRFDRREIRWGLLRQLLSFGGWMLLIQLSELIRRAVAPIILNKFAMAGDVASFHVGSLPGRHLDRGMNIVTRPLQPPLTAMHARGQKDRLRNAFLRGSRLTMWGLLIVAAPLIVYRSQVIALYTSGKYMTAVPVLMMLMMVLCAQIPNVMVGRVAVATARIRPLALRSAAMQLANLGLTIYLVGALEMGAMGAALSTLITGLFLWIALLCPLGLRMTGTSIRLFIREAVIPGVCPALIGAVVWAVVNWYFRPATWASMWWCFVIGAVCYSATLFLFCLRPKDGDDLRRLAVSVKGLFSRTGSSG